MSEVVLNNINRAAAKPNKQLNPGQERELNSEMS